jgi:hypothetical protein
MFAVPWLPLGVRGQTIDSRYTSRSLLPGYEI